MGGKGQGSSLQDGVSHTYTLRLFYNRISILYLKKKFNIIMTPSNCFQHRFSQKTSSFLAFIYIERNKSFGNNLIWMDLDGFGLLLVFF